MAKRKRPKGVIPLEPARPARRAYDEYPEQWPDRTTTDHREIGHGVPENPQLTWIFLVIVIVAILLIAA